MVANTPMTVRNAVNILVSSWRRPDSRSARNSDRSREV